MKIISCFVREQQRYTKNQLRSRFAYDDIGVEKFIKTLKSYGILKAVANTAEQKELTNLVDEDIQVVDETAGNDDCYYVFTYVGVITIGNRVIKVYPKYILSENEPLIRMKRVIKALERYSNSEEQIINLFNGDGDNRSFNILAVILYLLNDYYEYGIYNNEEDIIEINGEGDILWNRTIDEGFAIIEDGRPYYTELITHRAVEDDMDYFKRLHECVLTECSKQLHDAGLEELFEMETVNLSEETLADFGDTEYILEKILKELNIQFNTHRQILLKTLYTYISQDRKMLEEDQGISMFGTTAFHAVWEKACADVFGNKLGVAIGQLQMKEPLADKYDKKTKLIDLIEKPKWCGEDFIHQPKDTLIPDLITINEHNGKDCFIIFDAKYYLIQLEKGRTLRGNPGIGDVVKQYMYQLAYRKFLTDHNIAIVKNCFLMPTEGKEIINKGKAKLDMLSNLGLEDIQIRLIPAEMLFNCYLSRKKIDIEKLEL
nr:LlaJI family restriction endonuclease [Catenibacterium mitsuokai]